MVFFEFFYFIFNWPNSYSSKSVFVYSILFFIVKFVIVFVKVWINIHVFKDFISSTKKNLFTSVDNFVIYIENEFKNFTMMNFIL